MKILTQLMTFFIVLTINSVFAKDTLIPIRIGWQIPWATQGQLVQILKHTDILKKNGLKATFIGRTYGPLLNELALSKEIDIVLTADQPAVALFSKEKRWVAVGRLMYNRTLTYVLPNSKIKSLKDLKNKVIAIPIGAAAERITLAAVKSSGLDPKKDIKVVNLGIREQISLIKRHKGDESLGSIDALSGFDPIPAILESKGLIRPLHVGKVVSLVLMNEKFINKHKGVATNFMRSIVDAYGYFKKNRKISNEWFLEEAKLSSGSQSACNIAASIEPNLKSKNKKGIRVSFTTDDLRIIHEAALFMEPKLKKLVDIKKFVNNNYVNEL
ncbi:MAG: ABC transporter substrate-binding protein [Bacteriovoracaceae bacterium]|jgi:ABC-type nitrate/sulfonate/bicarbonate transport system substrate-binding protein|nr:ABC transporter substrate-binding protein [Bacteriovoracaceae bacterium]